MHNPGSKPPPGLSIFFPAYNDSGTIASLVIQALRTARRLTPDYEVIVVNDGSADGTADVLDELALERLELGAQHEPSARDHPIDRGAHVGRVRSRLQIEEGNHSWTDAGAAVCFRCSRRTTSANHSFSTSIAV